MAFTRLGGTPTPFDTSAARPLSRRASITTPLAGASGFAYKEWIGAFYPPGTKSAGMLGYYAGQFGSVEVNYTFRRSPTASMTEGWSNRVPRSFGALPRIAASSPPMPPATSTICAKPEKS